MNVSGRLMFLAISSTAQLTPVSASRSQRSGHGSVRAHVYCDSTDQRGQVESAVDAVLDLGQIAVAVLV